MSTVTPATRLDNLRAEIRETAALPRKAIIDLVAASQGGFMHVATSVDETLAATRRPNGWSLKDLVRHAIGAEERISHQVHELGAGRMPETYDLAEGKTMEVPDEGQSYDTFIGQLQAVNASMLRIVADVPVAFDAELRSSHTYGGRMNCLEWAVFQHIHDDSHSAYAHKIIAAISMTQA